jgi:hypothetical protein
MGKLFAAVLVIAAILFSMALPAFAASVEDIIKVKRDVLISKDMVVNDVVVLHGSVTVYGRIEGNVIIVGGSLYMKEGARVRGHAVIIGGQLEKDATAKIAGKTTQVYFPRFLPSMATLLAGGWIAAWAAISVMALLGFLGLSILLVALIPGNMGAAVGAMERSFGAALLWGVFWIIMIAPVALFLAISIVGIVLIPVQVLLVALAFLIGYIVSAIYIGKNVFQTLKRASAPFVDAILGILILHAVGFVPLFGAVLKAIFLIAGFGAVVTTKFGSRRAIDKP